MFEKNKGHGLHLRTLENLAIIFIFLFIPTPTPEDLFLSPPEGGLDLVTNIKGAI